MFRHANLPRIFNIYARFIFLVFYLQWLAAEVSEALKPQDTMELLWSSSFLMTHWAEMRYEYRSLGVVVNRVNLKEKIHNILSFDFFVKPSQSKQKANEKFITNILFNMYESNPLDRCKLEFILTSNPGFVISVTDKLEDDKRKGILAAYTPQSNVLYLYNFNTRYNVDMYRQSLLHEFHHVVDALNNFKNNFCTHDGYPKSLIHGNTSEQACAYRSPDALRVTTLIKEDFKSVVSLFESNNLPVSMRTQNQSNELTQLGLLLKLYNYLPRIFSADDVNDVRIFKDYHFNVTTKTYQLNDTKDALRYTRELRPLDKKSYLVINYLLEYHPSFKSGAWFFSKPFDTSEENLISDVLNNLVYRMSLLNYLNFIYSSAELSYEAGAHIDEVLSLYSHSVVHENKTTTLRGWLFPRLSEHEKTRHSPEYKMCLDREENNTPQLK
jgi:hypothetical protein